VSLSDTYGNVDSPILQCIIYHIHNWHTSLLPIMAKKRSSSLYILCSLLCVLLHNGPRAQTMIEIRPPCEWDGAYRIFPWHNRRKFSRVATRFSPLIRYALLWHIVALSAFWPHYPNSNPSSHSAEISILNGANGAYKPPRLT